jgi:membrane protease YdiL (CAAX protease family)
VSFGLAHVVYGNAIAPLLTTLGGFVFAYRYLRTNSLVAVSIEHALWGSFVFTIGFGWYLYSGSIR